MIRDVLTARARVLQEEALGEYHVNFRVEKKDLLDVAFAGRSARAIAELGCVWGVDCAYGRYALTKFGLKSVKMVDTHWTASALEAVARHPEIEVITRNFGDPDLPGMIGPVDAIVLFDVLLHQVAPDWDRVLQIYAPYTDSFLIFNPQWIDHGPSVRLLDLGREEYFRNVPHEPGDPPYQKLFDSMYETHPEHERIWRDVHHVWQWGITTADLLFTMGRLGFELDYFRNHGLDYFRSRGVLGTSRFAEQAFVFRKQRD